VKRATDRAYNTIKAFITHLYLPTVILTIIWYSITQSLFHSRMKPSFSANPSHCSPSFLLLKYSLHGFPGLFTVISEHFLNLFSTFSFSVFTLFSRPFRAVD